MSEGQRLRFYCHTCDTAVCSSCTDIEHADHGTDRLDIAMEGERKSLRETLDVALNKVGKINNW